MNTENTLPEGVTKVGSAWNRNGFELDFRTVKQSLPKGAAPLFAFGGRVYDGQGWEMWEVEKYINATGWDWLEICVFEREVGVTEPAPASLPSLATAQVSER